MNNNVKKAGSPYSSATGVFVNEFERRFLNLLTEAHKAVQQDDRINTESSEEYISALIFDYIDKSPQADEWRISLTPEYRRYKNAVLNHKDPKQSAPDIIIRFGNWTNRTSVDYRVVTQCVTDAIPPNYKFKPNPIVISDLHRQYVANIDSHLSNKHPVKGCVVMFLFQGDIKHIVNCINHHLCDCNRAPEILKKRPFWLNDIKLCFVSIHQQRSIQHLILDFSNIKAPEIVKTKAPEPEDCVKDIPKDITDIPEDIPKDIIEDIPKDIIESMIGDVTKVCDTDILCQR